MENADLAHLFSEVADIYEVQGASSFKVRALRNAARIVERSAPRAIGLAVTGGVARLQEIPGIGEGIAQRIVEVAETGALQEHEDLSRDVPPSLLELLEISGVGPKKVKLFREQLAIRDLDGLEQAARDGRLQALPGLGQKSEARILHAIERYRAHRGRTLLPRAEEALERLEAEVRAVGGIQKLAFCGSVRRRRETAGDVDLLCCAEDPARVLDRFAALGEVWGRGDTKCSIRLRGGLDADLRVVPLESFGAALHHFTGSKAHNIRIRGLAQKRGLLVNEYGVYELGPGGEAGRRVAGETEESVFGAVGLPWIPPELREDLGEIEAAAEGRLPRLLKVADLCGDLHMHTHATDGQASILEMAEAAIARGHRYIAITDHSKALAMTRGLDEPRLRAQAGDVREAQAALGDRIRVFRGIEVDILRDGALDLEADALSELDCVVGSVHSHFELSRDEMTARLLRAVQSGLVDVLGHPTGRLLLRRDPYVFDVEAVLAACAKHGVALELSASPYRLDLSDAHARLAREKGGKLVINTDAHHPDQLDLLPYGVGTARRAWLGPDAILNAEPDPDAFLQALHRGHRP